MGTTKPSDLQKSESFIANTRSGKTYLGSCGIEDSNLKYMIKGIIGGLYPILIALPLWFQQQSINKQIQAQLVFTDALCDDYQSQVQTLTDSLVVYKESLDSLWRMHPYLNKESLVKLYSFVDKYQYCPGTRFITKENINPEMDRHLYKALSTYTGPPATITSLYRPHSHGSDHKNKLAVDIRWNENGKLMAEWLLTEDGVKGIRENNLTIHLENVPERKYRKGVFEEFYMWNPNATGPHIHVSVDILNETAEA